MAASDILIKIESTYEVENIRLSNDRKVWPLLRHKIVYAKFKESTGYDNKLRTRNKKQLFLNFFSGMHHLFRLKKFDFIFFTNTDKRVPIDGKYFDIYFDAWADRLGQKKCLYLEWARDKHIKKSKNYSSNVISDLPFKLAITLVSRILNIKFKDEAKFEDLVRAHKLPLTLRKELKSKLAEVYVFKFFFKIIKPKAVFVLSSYSRISIVIAAKELGIKVYETQHGYIGDEHTFYSAEKQFKESYPDYLISFGSYEKQAANPKLIFKPEQILPVGSFQLELIKNQPLSKELLDLKKSYSVVFCVTLQAIKEEELLNWVLREAKDHTEWLFVIRAKNNDAVYSNYTRQENIITLDDYTIYEVLKISDYNITIFSTTAIEGLYLGAEPIFFNVNNLSKDHFDVEKMNAIIIEGGEQLSDGRLSKQIKKENAFFIDNYFENVKKENLFF